MRKVILSALIALIAVGGVASADRRRDETRRAQGGVVVTPSRGHVDSRPHYDNHQRWGRTNQRYNRGHYRPAVTYRYVRRPIYVQRPVIQYHYRNYQRRPALLVETYRSMPGYFWVAGRWDWNGYEWQWTPGHYQPDPNAAGYYSNDYHSGYYENPTYDSSISVQGTVRF